MGLYTYHLLDEDTGRACCGRWWLRRAEKMVTAERYAIARLRFNRSHPDFDDRNGRVLSRAELIRRAADQSPDSQRPGDLVPDLLVDTCERCLAVLSNPNGVGINWDSRWFEDVETLTGRYEAEAEERRMREAADSAAWRRGYEDAKAGRESRADQENGDGYSSVRWQYEQGFNDGERGRREDDERSTEGRS